MDIKLLNKEKYKGYKLDSLISQNNMIYKLKA